MATYSGLKSLCRAATSGHFRAVAAYVAVGSGTFMHVQATMPGAAQDITAAIAIGKPFNGVNKDKKTPLYVAAENGHSSTMEALIAAGADLNVADKNGRHLLEIASTSSSSGHSSYVCLQKAFAKSNIRNKDGNTIVHLLALNPDGAQGVRVVIAAGAALDAVNKDGKTPLYVAVEKGHVSTVNELVVGGANLDCKAKVNSPIYHVTPSRQLLHPTLTGQFVRDMFQ